MTRERTDEGLPLNADGQRVRRRLEWLGAACLLLCAGAGVLWMVWLVQELTGPITTAGHHDFFALYAASTLVHAHQAQSLYSAAAITAIERRVFAQPTGYAGYMPYLNPPAFAAIVSPLAGLSEPGARLVWLLVTLVIAAVCVGAVAHAASWQVRAVSTLAILCTFPAYQTLVEGQWSYLMLLGALMALRLGWRRHEVLAGVFLVFFWIKPPLFLLIIVWLLVTRRWKVVGAAIASVATLTLVTLPLTGWQANLNYAGFLVRVTAAHAAGGGAASPTAWEGAFANMEGLLGLAATLVGQQHATLVDILTVVFDLGLLTLFVHAFRRHSGNLHAELGLAVGAATLGLLLDPHLYAQDCLLLLIPVVLLLRSRSPVYVSASPWRAVVLLTAASMLLDLTAIDTLWSQGLFPAPLHLATLVMIAVVVFASLRAQALSSGLSAAGIVDGC